MCVWRETLCCFSSYFFTTLTGIVVSEDVMAGTSKGVSTVSSPSGDSEDVTFSMSAVGGRLEGSEKTRRRLLAQGSEPPPIN